MVKLSDFDCLKYINVPLFLISLAIGVFFVYVTAPPLKVIYVYPTPDNINQVQYKDFTDTCFSFDSNKVQCPKDKKDITDIPVQHT